MPDTADPPKASASRDRGRGRGETRRLDGDQRRLLALLGLPTFGLALAITTVSTYLPAVARQFTASTVVIGVIVATEGIMALWLPLVSGTWSDRLRTPLGGRLPFLLAGTPVVAAALVLMGLVNSILAVALVALVFFVGYFIAYEPYRALYPDLVSEDATGRAQSVQALFRGAGTGLALLGGGLLFSLAEPAPFVAAAGVVLAAVVAFAVVLRRSGRLGRREAVSHGGVADGLRELRSAVRRTPALGALLVANALWELSLGALKTFIFLFLTQGLGYGRTTSALVVGAAAVVILAGAVAAGKLGDRIGKVRVLRLTLPLYGLGLLVPLFFTASYVLVPVVAVVAAGGGVIMALPYAVLIPLMPKGEHGAMTGVYSFSRGVGTALGPLLAGIAITVLRGPLHSTHGYAAMWLVCSAAILASLPFLGRVSDDEPDAGGGDDADATRDGA